MSGTSVVRRLAHDPRAELLQPLLQRREVLDRVGLAVADDHVGAAVEDRRDELGDVAAVVLVVGVGVDDDVGAELEAGVEARLEAGGQPLVVRQLDDVVDAVGAGDLDRAVGRAVVDDQPLDGVEARRPRGGGRRASPGSVSSSLRQGIWMMSFMRGGAARRRARRARRAVHSRSEYLRGSEGGDLHAPPSAPGRPTPTSHGERDAHPPRREHGLPARLRAVPARVWARAGVRAAVRRGHGRVPGVPDVSQLRLGLLADVGPRARRRRAAELRRLPRADRAPAGVVGRRGARAARATRRPRVWSGAHGRGVLRARGRRLPARARRVHAVGRRVAAAAAPHAASTTRSWPLAATSTCPTWRWWSGPRRSRPSGRVAGRPVWLLLACAGLLRPEAWLLAGAVLVWCAWPAQPLARARAHARGRGGGAGRCGRSATCGAPATPLFSLHHTSSLAADLAAHASRERGAEPARARAVEHPQAPGPARRAARGRPGPGLRAPPRLRSRSR